MLLPPADDENYLPFDAGGKSNPAAAQIPAVTPAIVHEAFQLRNQFGATAEAEVSRRITLAMEDCRVAQVEHLWALWLALKGHN